MQTITKLWVMHWIWIKLLLTATRTIYWTLSWIYISLTILQKHSTATTSLGIHFITFSISWLCTVYIYIVFIVLNLWELILWLVILHDWMVCRLTSSTYWFTWLLRSSSWLSSRIISWTIDNKAIFRYTLDKRAIMRISAATNNSATMGACVDMLSFHLDLLQLLVKFQLLLMLSRWEAWSVIYMTTSRNTRVLANLYRCLLLWLHLLIWLLRIPLVAWYVHSFRISCISLNQYVLIWIRVFAWEKSSLCLSFSSFFDHSFLWSWAFTFGNMWYSFESTKCKCLIVLDCRGILLLSQCLFELELLLHFKLFIS